MKNNFFVELNGIANIKMLADEVLKSSSHDDETLKNMALLYRQLDLTERYMLAVAEAARKGEAPPEWSEVASNPSRFPNNEGK